MKGTQWQLKSTRDKGSGKSIKHTSPSQVKSGVWIEMTWCMLGWIKGTVKKPLFKKKCFDHSGQSVF